MPSFRLNFTKAALLKAGNAEQGKRDYYYDDREQGLVMDVTPSGSKAFYLYRRVDGRPERIFLGRFPDLSIENARIEAQKRKGQIAVGVNPQVEKRKLKAEMTFGQLFELYMKRYSKPHKRSWQYDEREVNKFLSHWFNRRISMITADEVHRLHSQIGSENGLYQANRLLERLRAILNKGMEWGWEGPNPAAKVKKFKEKSRDRFLQPEEFPKFFKALAEEENKSAKDFILMSLLTGARKSNVLTMKWDEIDFHFKTWRIPETKNGEPLTLPLTDKAVELLKARKKSAKGLWVFPSPRDDKEHLQDPKKAWGRIMETAGIKNFRIHDLRRTLGSYQATTGANSYVIQKSLGHKSAQSTAIYARLNLDPVRDSVNKAANTMLRLAKAKK
ncbi:MAG TPA: tyrosine-type recombinase/integrase [Alphaproteobacteria bacterium]|nr:tyrosine-type recombinase/integrase [Alphaproteobacteria bacterium]